MCSLIGKTRRFYFLFLTFIIPAFSQTPTTIQLNSFPNPAVFGQPVTITAAVSPSAATGKVTFYSGATVLGTQVLNSGQATLTTTQLPAGKGPLKAFYLGSTAYLVSTSSPLPQTVNTLPSAGLSLANGTPTPAGSYPEPVVFGDFNGDGKLDMALAGLQASTGAVFILLGDGNGNFTPTSAGPIVVGGLPRSLAMADFNGDGKMDLATCDSQGTNVTVLLNDGTGNFTIAPGSPVVAGPAFFIAAGDFDGDGNADLVVTNYTSSGNISVFLGNGAGGFRSAPGSPFSAGNSPSSIALADFNGDGITDLAVTNALDSTVTIMLGNGSGGFSASSASPFAVCSGSWYLAAADFNEDGKPDLAIACSVGGGTPAPPPTLTVLLQDSNGDGGFTQPSGSPYSVGCLALAVGDFNGDGHLDLAAVDDTSNTVTILKGDGSGKFAAAFGGAFPVNEFPYFAAVGDVNGDGLADIAVVAETSGVVDLFLGVPGVTVQTLAFPAQPTQVLGSAPFIIAASASSGLPVGFSSSDTTVCSVSGAVVALIAAGTCSITATQPGNATFMPASPVTVTFAVRASFTDTGSESAVFLAAIDEILSKGITSGCTASSYCPSLNLTRGQMAVFIIRSIYGSNNFTYNPTPWFTDAVADSTSPNYTTFFKYIQKMKELGITAGCTATTYCPNLNVTRGEMAVFIIRARYGANFAFDYPSSPYFTDAVNTPATLPDTSPNPNYTTFFRYIQRLKQDSITSGCTATTFCPNAIVTRDQVAVFLSRATFNNLLPSATPLISNVAPATGGLGDTVNVTITGVNTSFVQGTTAISPTPGFTVQTVTVSSPTSMTAQLLIGSSAMPGPESIVAITGSQEAVAPNAFTITSDPAAGALAWFSGNGNNVNSISGLTGTAFGTVAYASALSRTQGIPDAQAFNMIGFPSYLRLSSSESAMVTGARTLVAWVNPSQAGALGQPIITGGQSFTAFDVFGITPSGRCLTAAPYHLYIEHNATCYLSNLTLAPNTWSMAAVTFDGTNAVFYINGVASVPVPTQMYDYALSTFEVGGSAEEWVFGTLGTYFQGLLNEVQIYGRALTPAEIQGLYQP